MNKSLTALVGAARLAQTTPAEGNTDIRLCQNWHCNQLWSNSSDAVLSTSFEPGECIPLVVLWEGQNTLLHVHWPLFVSKKTNFRRFFRKILWQITNPVVFSTTIFTHPVAYVRNVPFTVPYFTIWARIKHSSFKTPIKRWKWMYFGVIISENLNFQFKKSGWKMMKTQDSG